MRPYSYAKKDKKHTRSLIRFFGFFSCLIGITMMLYIFFPLVSWEIYSAPVFASQDVTTPIPKAHVLSSSTIKNLLLTDARTLGIDYTNAQNWFSYAPSKNTPVTIPFYNISIPKIHITNAVVSTVDTDLASHLVHFGGTALPPNKGTAVIFGHSTLPQLWDPNNYKTIFANAYLLTVGDTIAVTMNHIVYTYNIISLTVVDPEDTSVFVQNYNDSYLSIVTCTPPGTVWKRLIITAHLAKIQ